ncbi:FAD-binding protein [Humibacter sp. BT305]|nr:FAD-binding protein [Humibacter sp. BT305]
MRTAVIVGGGIGGLTAALALRECGWDVTVLEQSPELSEIGAGIQIAPNATRVLVALGLRDALERVAVTPLEQVRRRWSDGEVIASMPMGDELERRYGAPYWQLHRGDLFRVLLDACRDPDEEGRVVRILTSFPVVSVEDSGARATAVAADGRRVSGDLLLGADGLRSTVRTSAGFPGELLRENEISYRALIPRTVLEADPETEWITHRPDNTLWYGPGAHAVHFFLHGGETLCLVVQKHGSDERLDDVPSALVTRDEFVATVPGWTPRLLSLLAEAGDDVLLQPLLHRAPHDDWVHGRIALLGDAAHAMLPYQGQGGSQAIEDAGVLAAELGGPGADDIEAALERYRARRAPIAAELQRASLVNKHFLHLPDGPEQRARDALLRHRFAGDGGVTFDWMWSH